MSCPSALCPTVTPSALCPSVTLARPCPTVGPAVSSLSKLKLKLSNNNNNEAFGLIIIVHFCSVSEAHRPRLSLLLPHVQRARISCGHRRACCLRTAACRLFDPADTGLDRCRRADRNVALKPQVASKHVNVKTALSDSL